MTNLIGQTIGNYEVIRLLGQGGMASVYLARQTNMDRDVAIKVMKASVANSSEYVARFRREAKTVASLSHIHISKVFDYGQHEDMIYLVMELMTGGSLADLLRQGSLPLEMTAKMLKQVASALDYAHKKGMVHRDVKPQNVLLDDDGNAHLTDFGIVKLAKESRRLSREGSSIGTALYMSPEQCLGHVDARSDVYSLGIMLYEMLTGSVPFLADTPLGVLHKHLHDLHTPVRELRSGLPRAVEDVLDKVLAKNPDQRYQSAGALAEAFEAAITQKKPVRKPKNQKVQPVSQTILEYPPELAKRKLRKVLAIGASVSVLILVAIFGIVSVLGTNSTPAAVSTATQKVAVNPTATTLPSATSTNVPIVVPTSVPSTQLPTATAIQVTATSAPASTSIPPTATATSYVERILYYSADHLRVANLNGEPLGSLDCGAGDWVDRVTDIVVCAGVDGRLYLAFPTGEFAEIAMVSDVASWSRPAYSPKTGWIAYATTTHGINIVSYKEVRQLTTRLDYSPSWSPNDSQIVFERYDRVKDTSDIFVMDADGGNQRSITKSGQAHDPSWSPDGKQIAFWKHDKLRDTNDIFVMDVDGLRERQITKTGKAKYPSWSPDGNKLMFTSLGDGEYTQLSVINVDGTGYLLITNDSWDHFRPVWGKA